MRLVMTDSWQPGLQWLQRTLFASAGILLGYCVFVLADAWSFQNDQQQQFSRLLETRRGEVLEVVSPANATPTVLPAPARGLVGRLEISRLGVSEMVMEGTSEAVLRRAVGHIPGTGLPGKPGNVGLSGHRDTFFRPLKNIREHDIITLTTLRGKYRYRVVSTKVVAPDDVAVLKATGEESLTLVTCYPFTFVGSAPDRFIVRAKRVT